MKNYSRIRLNGITIFIFNKNLTEEKRVYRRRKTNDSKAELVPSERQIEDEISVQIKCDTESDVKEEECEIGLFLIFLTLIFQHPTSDFTIFFPSEKRMLCNVRKECFSNPIFYHYHLHQVTVVSSFIFQKQTHILSSYTFLLFS